ncbi:hypothetical protein [Sediminicola luteus]|uniref:hypothetical protein n=1 Tax=Sediminicola luteus TaxID=319238 RepID=UPI001144BA9A|nr:hypothetical protein [Sediminicola luteus]
MDRSGKQNVVGSEKSLDTFVEKNYVLYSVYEKGDSRRYGVFPDKQADGSPHPFSGKSKIQTLLDISERGKIEIRFTEGYYPFDLTLIKRRNVRLIFENATFKTLYLTNENEEILNQIKLEGTLKLVDRLGAYNINGVEMDSIIVYSDTTNVLLNYRNRGCKFYKKTNNVKIKYLKISDVGSGSKLFENTYAALMIDGMGDNPKNISIQEVVISNVDRNGMYVSGNNHSFGIVNISSFGKGSKEHLNKIQETVGNEYLTFCGIWINRCEDTYFRRVNILADDSLEWPVFMKLDEGPVYKPVVIDYLEMNRIYEDTLIYDKKTTNVLIKRVKDSI